MTKSINYVLYRLWYFKNFISPTLRNRDYVAFSMGKLLWYQYDRLQKLQNVTVRYVSDIKFPKMTSPSRLQLGWVNVRLRQKYLCAVYIYNTLSHNLPPYLKDKINIYISTRDLRRQLRSHLKVLTCKCSQLNNSSLVYILDFWNTLPEYTRLAQTIDSFKHNI